MSEAVGGVHVTVAVQPFAGRFEIIDVGQFDMVGGTVSMEEAAQHNAPPLLLRPALMVKLPKVLPTITPDAQPTAINVSTTPSTLISTLVPANFSLTSVPPNVNVEPGTTTPENTRPNWSLAVMLAATEPLKRKVKLVRPPMQVPQLFIGGQSHP